jgi:hypothetical protein
MELTTIIPTKQGQVCKIINPLPDEKSDEVYLVCEDPSIFDDDGTIYITSLKELQRNIKNPELAEQFGITKNELTVIAEDIESFIYSWK